MKRQLLRAVVASLTGALASACAVALAFLSLLLWDAPGLAFPLAAVAFLYALPLALGHALLLAMPLYALLALGLGWRVQAWNAALAGFVIGALPTTVWTGLIAVGAIHADLESLARSVLMLGGTGAIGGFVFHRMMRSSEASQAGAA